MMNKTIKIILIPLAVIALGATLAWGLSRRRKTVSFQPPAPPPQMLANTPDNQPIENQQQSVVTEFDDCPFPLKFGSNNRCVKLLQEALIKAFSREGALPAYGADGDWGNETEIAMNMLTQSNQIDNAENLQAFLNFYNQ